MSSLKRTGRRVEEELEELKRIAERFNIEVREEELLREVGYHAKSGPCRVRNRKVLLIDRKLPPSERLEVLIRELRNHNLDGIYLSPALRRRFDLDKGNGKGDEE